MTKTQSGRIAFILVLLSAVMFVRADDPTVRIDPLPTGWEPGMADTKFLQMCTAPKLHANCELDQFPNVDGKIDFNKWVESDKKHDDKARPGSDRKATELKSATVGGRKVMECEATWTVFGENLHYRIFYYQVGNVLCKLLCSVPPAHWDAANPQFEMLVKNTK